MLLVLVTGALEVTSRRAEASGEAYPHRWEDWLRYLEPTMWRADGPSLMLTGPSTAREAFLVDEFARAFPAYRIRPAAVSLGTFRDITAGLEYVERAYGRAALPSVVVLGISPRFLAEIPGERPFAQALQDYSRRFGPLTDSTAAFGLSRKGNLDGLLDEVRYRTTHQSGRYRTAVAWSVTRVMSPRASARIRESAPATFLARTPLGELAGLGDVVRMGPREAALRFIGPYRYQPVRRAWPSDRLAASLDDTVSMWRDVFRWDPETDAGRIRQRSIELRDWATQRGIELYVIRLPEHSFIRERTNASQLASFMDVVHSAFEGVPVLDLGCFLPDSEFMDGEHPLWHGAKRISNAVTAFIEDARQAHHNRQALEARGEQWSEGSCAVDR